jgi:hypothetical protein
MSTTPQRLLVGRRHPHRDGGGLRLVRGAPQDRGAALGRDHRVDGILERDHDVADGDRQRAARAAPRP